MPFAWRFGAPPAANNPALVSSESAAGLADQAAVLLCLTLPTVPKRLVRECVDNIVHVPMDGRHGERAGLAIVAERETRLLIDARCLIDSLSCAIPIHGSLLQVRDSIGYADPVYEYSKYSLTFMFFRSLSPSLSFSISSYTYPDSWRVAI
ncbi:hypothetical protein CI102_5857 [Trichoderma harzianum]|jgi:hypothetical protein|nr:hypothetical protein CI102_5857 [Trichoderma harzianum]